MYTQLHTTALPSPPLVFFFLELGTNLAILQKVMYKLTIAQLFGISPSLTGMQSAIQILYLKIHAPNPAYVLKYVKFSWTERYLNTLYNAAEIIMLVLIRHF